MHLCSRRTTLGPRAAIFSILILFGLGTPSAYATTTEQLLGIDAMGAFTTLRLSNARQFVDTMAERFTASRYERRLDPADFERLKEQAAAGGSRTALEYPGSTFGDATFDLSPGRTDQGFGTWADGYGIFSSVDGSGATNAIDSSSWGFGAGFDYRLPQVPTAALAGVRLGGALGFSRTAFSASPSTVEGWGNTVHVGVYGSYTLSRFWVGAAGRFGFADLHTQRSYWNGAGIVDMNGAPDGDDTSAHVEVGGLIGDPEVVALWPVLAYDYTRLGQDLFSETGNGLSMMVDGITEVSSVTTVGFRLSRVFANDPSLISNGPVGEFGFEPELRLSWSHEFGDIDRDVLAQYPTTGLVLVPGAVSGRDYFGVGAGYEMRFSASGLLALDYDARIDSKQVDHLLRLTLALHW